MAVKFAGDLNTLVHDLEIRGYRVRKAERIAGAAGRTADVFLTNGAVVQWDAYSHTVWADGPVTESQRTETYLRCLYEGGIFGRLWVATVWNSAQSFRYLRAKLLHAKAAALRTIAAKIYRPLQSVPAPEQISAESESHSLSTSVVVRT